MSHTPLEWYHDTKAQTYIGLIAAGGHKPDTRTTEDRIGGVGEVEFYDCPEFNDLLMLHQRAVEAAFAAFMTDRSMKGEWDRLSQQNVAAIVNAEIARRGLQVAA